MAKIKINTFNVDERRQRAIAQNGNDGLHYLANQEHPKTYEFIPYENIKPLIIDWSIDKKINNPDNQTLKFFEELGELAQGILKNDLVLIKDSIGDISVVLIILGYQKNFDYDFSYEKGIEEAQNRVNKLDKHMLLCNLSVIGLIETISCFNILEALANKYDTTLIECLNIAWNEIKNRTGNTIDGNFIKDE